MPFRTPEETHQLKRLYAQIMEKHPVKLYVYDISRGFARQMSPVLLGKI